VCQVQTDTSNARCSRNGIQKAHTRPYLPIHHTKLAHHTAVGVVIAVKYQGTQGVLTHSTGDSNSADSNVGLAGNVKHLIGNFTHVQGAAHPPLAPCECRPGPSFLPPPPPPPTRSLALLPAQSPPPFPPPNPPSSLLIPRLQKTTTQKPIPGVHNGLQRVLYSQTLPPLPSGQNYPKNWQMTQLGRQEPMPHWQLASLPPHPPQTTN
jgi:hypothetical protein